MNNGSLEELQASIDRAVEETMALFKAGTLPKSRWHAWWEATAPEREAAAQAAKEKAEAEKKA